MTRILFLPNPNTLLWLETDQPARAVLEDILAGRWVPPVPFHNLPCDLLSATCQDEVVTVTIAVPTAPAVARLSPRQIQVLRGLAEGQTTRQIARRLKVSPRMVLYYIAELKRKFQAQTRAEVISKSNEVGSIDQNPPPPV